MPQQNRTSSHAVIFFREIPSHFTVDRVSSRF